ncbi:hypothetical protein EMIHUDRAFT_458321 [Emiliania huxleyi CCMP1516]|uniref:Uncharacterized protein n=2 Tax=Emiliania huxleyi TaxID=2903 RepID=A0A0D3JDH0_EMIH1|nr:hypothetical protein EMIHUDRAFT_458321 [Emiliania huxleyi CCMP1516]EOD21555.1 hypothetical protein EMIHUDRAFT_458321 [Emiliania huxleyi CCMP1516]|eukprot:XP_005773984.1 hypothetical protein EMIHUDRAFT_458321 [Emiliania huxleyi CCMP1516]
MALLLLSPSVCSALSAAPVSSWYDSGVRLPSSSLEGKVMPTGSQVWPAIGGTAGFHRGAGRLGKKRARLAPAASDSMFLDEAAALRALDFPLSEAELISAAKAFLFYGQGTEKPELLAPEFVFMGPYVGGADGLPRDEYLKAVGGFDLKAAAQHCQAHTASMSAAFPDLNPRFHHFRADPLDAGRVWFTSQASGTDGAACSLKFDASGLAIKYTIGHVMERSLGNTGGLGGIFGPAYAIGRPLPFPEARPWRPSKRYRLLQAVGQFVAFLNERKK